MIVDDTRIARRDELDGLAQSGAMHVQSCKVTRRSPDKEILWLYTVIKKRIIIEINELIRKPFNSMKI